MSAVAGETVVFLEATAVFVLAVAEVHGIPAEHRERRRALVLAVLVGEDGKHAVADLIGPGRTSGALAGRRRGVAAAACGVAAERRGCCKFFVKKYALKRGAIAFGKLLPVGIGAVVGGVGNRMMGKKIIANARMAFGNSAAAVAGDAARAARSASRTRARHLPLGRVRAAIARRR